MTYNKIFLILLLLIIIFHKLLFKLSVDLKILSKQTYNSFFNYFKNVEGYHGLNYSKYNDNNLQDSISNIFKNNENKYNLDSYPNVEINPNKPLLLHNNVLPECCLYDNQYSSSNGCPCITPEQSQYLKNRGLSYLESTTDISYTQNVYFSPTQTFKQKNQQFVDFNKEYKKTN